MASNYAYAYIAGNLVAEPHQVFPADRDKGRSALVRIRVAVNNNYMDKTGAWKEAGATFIDVDCWGELAMNVYYSMKKGTAVTVSGRLQLDTWNEPAPDSLDPKATSKKRSLLKIKASHVAVDLSRSSAIVGESYTKRLAQDTQHIREKDEYQIMDALKRSLLEQGVDSHVLDDVDFSAAVSSLLPPRGTEHIGGASGAAGVLGEDSFAVGTRDSVASSSGYGVSASFIPQGNSDDEAPF